MGWDYQELFYSIFCHTTTKWSCCLPANKQKQTGCLAERIFLNSLSKHDTCSNISSLATHFPFESSLKSQWFRYNLKGILEQFEHTHCGASNLFDWQHWEQSSKYNGHHKGASFSTRTWCALCWAHSSTGQLSDIVRSKKATKIINLWNNQLVE